MAAAGEYSLDVSGSVIPGGDAGAPPVFSPLPLASVFGAIERAMAIAAALVARERDGLGQRSEVPLFDAPFEAIGLRGLSYERNGPKFTDVGAGLYRCADGRYLLFIASGLHQLGRFVEATAAPRRARGADTETIRAALDAATPAPSAAAGRAQAGDVSGGPPLAGFRVVDLSRVVAAPTAAKLLAQLGADVVKIDED